MELTRLVMGMTAFCCVAVKLPAPVTACVNAWDSVGYRMKSFGNMTPLACADYQDLYSPDARKVCPFDSAKQSITDVEAKARALLDACSAAYEHSPDPNSWMLHCGGLFAEWQRDSNLLVDVLAAGPWEKCTPDSCAVRIGATGTTIGSTGGNGSVSVTAKAANCPWTVSNTASWIHLITPSSGSGPGTVRFKVYPNNDIERSAKMTIGPRDFVVTEKGVPCTITPNITAITAPAGGQEGTIQVSTNLAGCFWRASSANGYISPWVKSGIADNSVGGAREFDRVGS
jgi:hypothetical protein